ncbi:trans-acting enoyl reductase family protein [Rhodoferax sp. PAMC 29310]|uniref:saccharopine dehydrogenase family protein n=1 Tax=Rhodoferax sp. PAMC 29310 TaxID=2822760 RepID=UPI001B31FBA3|nr:saccharopine dehydrogenase NADP-binding domain-containing protein [Rhodoferax sp. PAMC 29310]
MTQTSTPKKKYDVILYGASGFVGRQTVAYFAAHPDVQTSRLRWALAGRSRPKLEAVRASISGANKAGIVVAEAHDTAAMDALAASARVVLSTAGPFALYGSELVAACVRHGTHYVDITGETPWVKGLIDQHDVQAQKNGARIIPFCGFDSIPSDLSAWLAHRAMREQFDEECVRVKVAFSLRGGFNGGTLASMFNMLEQGQMAQMADPFLLNPPGSRPAAGGMHADPVAPRHDGDFSAWLGPFMMSTINTRVVRRSAALLGYGNDYGYQEYLRLGRGLAAALAATTLSVGSATTQAVLRLRPVRWLAKKLAPAPGEGPSEAGMDSGSFRARWVGESASGHKVRGEIADQGDPSNRATTKMLCESALCLALQQDELPGGRQLGGLLTPASGLGDVLVGRLRAAGMMLKSDSGQPNQPKRHKGRES